MTTDTKQRSKITDVELLAAAKAGHIELVIDQVKDSKKGGFKFIPTFRYVANGKLVLTESGVIDAEARLLFGVRTSDKRNTGQFAKTGPDAKDECEMTFGTKYSGTFGALMEYVSDVMLPKAVTAFGTRPDSAEFSPTDQHFTKCVYQKEIGAKDKRNTPEGKADQAKYVAEADWRFGIVVKIETVTEKSGERVNRPFMWKLNEPVIEAGRVVKREIAITSANVHEKLTRNSTFKIGMTFGPLTRKPAKVPAIGSNPAYTIWTYYPSFNIGELTLIEQAPARGAREVKRDDSEMAELAARLAKSKGAAAAAPAPVPGAGDESRPNRAGGALTVTPPPSPTGSNNGDHDSPIAGAAVPPPAIVPGAGASSASIRAQLGGLCGTK